MSDERESWEGVSDEELQDGLDDGEEGAIVEYSSRLFAELSSAKALLRRWARHHLHPGLEYETVAYLDGVEAARAISSGIAPPGSVPAAEASEDAKESAGARAIPEPTLGTCRYCAGGAWPCPNHKAPL